jgi:diguanylate cyclase
MSANWVRRPARRGIWYGLAAGLAVFVAGDVVYSVYAYALQLEPFPSPADALYLASIRCWRPPCWS